MPKRYPEEFRRKVLDLVAAGRPVAQIAADLGISDQTIYGWRKQELIDTGQLPGLNRAELAELSAANKRIRELETEVAILKRARELLQGAARPKRRYAAIATMAAEGLPVQVACRLLSVAQSGYYAWRSRPPSARAVRHAWLTDQIRAVHNASRGTLRHPAGPRRTDPRTGPAGRPQPGRDADGPRRHQGPAGNPAPPGPSRDSDGD